ncbi:MAG: hypothetical protein K0Q79_1883 [Flavipsychrobacter sp.]|nr:hypothetical protein [Flavipsychrobacter sp.]
MKKLFPLLLFVAFSFSAKAQPSFTLVTPPCHNDGVLSATFTGLTPPVTVKWYTHGSAGTTIMHTGVVGPSDALTGYSGGPISISATDALGVFDSGDYAGAPPFTICPLSIAAGVCPAKDTLTASMCGGGTAPFHYEWYEIATSGIVGTMNPTPVTPGNIYGVTVTDAAGCTYGSLVEDIQIFAYVLPSFSDSISTTTAACTNGSAEAVVYGGGAAPFTYKWSTGATTRSIGSLVTGTYQVTVTDAVGCAVSAFGFVPQSISVTAPVVPTPASCTSYDGTVIAFGTGGTAPYSYVWSNGATTQSQCGLGTGFYTINVTDANGCIGMDGGFVGVSTPIAITYTTTPSLCTSPTGNATLTIGGGTPPYTTTWHTSPAHTGITATLLKSGNYYFEVTDAMGCKQSGTAFVPPINTISLSFLATPAVCTAANGKMTVYPVGGPAPYTYVWNTGATTATITGRQAGNHTVTVTDAVGCKTTRTYFLPSTSPVGVGVVTTPSTCLYANNGIDSAWAWGGTPPYAYGWSTGGTTRVITGVTPGPYWVHATDAAGCTTPRRYSYMPYDTTNSSCYCTIEGTVYHDGNNNCVQDVGEPGISNIQIKIAGSTFGTAYTYTNASGYYSYKVPSGIYTVSQKLPAHHHLAACQLNDIPLAITASTGCLNTVNFADSTDTARDVHISTWNYAPPVAGNTYSQITIVTNDGTITADSLLITYRPDGQLYVPAFVNACYFSGGSNYYTADSMPSLAPGASTRFYMNYHVPANMPVGTNVSFRDTAVHIQPTSNWLTDASPWNNIRHYSTQVVASYEPNFKEVSPKGAGTAGMIPHTDSVLEYMVHFQNTGNWMAENVMVIDTLDDNLDWTTLRPVYYSSPCQVTLTQNGTRKIAKFMFNNINLPTRSADEVRSNGMFTYTVHIKPGLAVGSQFRNRASIYFDHNEPISTNTTLNTLSSSGASNYVNNVTSAVANSFTIYPNPAENSFSAVISSEFAANAEMRISDITGRTMMTKTVSLQKGSQTIPVDASSLAAGTYLVTLSTGQAVQTQKLVIMKR